MGPRLGCKAGVAGPGTRSMVEETLEAGVGYTFPDFSAGS